MKPLGTHNYFVYITTNFAKTVLYIGVTNNLKNRLYQHQQNKEGSDSFTGKYHCYNLLYFERFDFIEQAIKREKEIKRWRREKKDNLISLSNPEWKFLNNDIG